MDPARARRPRLVERPPGRSLLRPLLLLTRASAAWWLLRTALAAAAMLRMPPPEALSERSMLAMFLSTEIRARRSSSKSDDYYKQTSHFPFKRFTTFASPSTSSWPAAAAAPPPPFLSANSPSSSASSMRKSCSSSSHRPPFPNSTPRPLGRPRPSLNQVRIVTLSLIVRGWFDVLLGSFGSFLDPFFVHCSSNGLTTEYSVTEEPVSDYFFFVAGVVLVLREIVVFIFVVHGVRGAVAHLQRQSRLRKLRPNFEYFRIVVCVRISGGNGSV